MNYKPHFKTIRTKSGERKKVEVLWVIEESDNQCRVMAIIDERVAELTLTKRPSQ